MAHSFLKPLMGYSLLVVGFLIVRKYVNISLEPSTPSGANPDVVASAIIELTENIEYRRRHALYIPPSDRDAREEMVEWMTQAADELGMLIDRYIQESGIDASDMDVLEVQDRRGRQVKLSLRHKGIEESPDQIGYKRQKEMLKNTNWGNDPEL